MDTLAKLKIMLGIAVEDTSQDPELELLLDDTQTDLLTWTNRLTLPAPLESIQRQIAVMRYNKQGVEGQSSHSEGGIGRSFEDLPISMQAAINQYRKLKVASYETP